MRAHVIRENIVEDRPMLGEVVARLFLERDVEVLVFERGGGMLAGYGPVDVEVKPDPRLLTPIRRRRVSERGYATAERLAEELGWLEADPEHREAFLAGARSGFFEGVREERVSKTKMHRRAQKAESREAGARRRLRALAAIAGDLARR